MKRNSVAANRKLLDAYRRKLDALKQNPAFDPNESHADKSARIKRALADPQVFAETYFPHYCTSVCAPFHVAFARRVAKHKNMKAVVRWPRGHAKSVWCDILIPIWLWARGEKMYMVLIGSSFDKAKVLLSDVQVEFEANERLLADFGDQRMEGSWEDGRFVTKGGFVGHALGMGQSVRGLRHRALRPTYCVPDDCETKDIVKNPKRQHEMARWVEMDLLGTMDGEHRRLLIANNGFAPDMIQKVLLKKHPSWHLDEVKAYDKVSYECAWPAKYTPEYWQELETENGKLSVYAEYLHEPHVEGTLFTDDLFNYGKPPRLDHLVKITAHWDVAYAGTSTADYNAVRVWGLDKEGNFWLLACYVKQSKMSGALRWMVDYDKSLPANVIVHWRYESQFWNVEVERTIQEVCDAAGHELMLAKVDTPKANKYDRILSTHVYYQNGRVWYNEKLIGQGDHEVGLSQLKGIESGYSGHDDAPDADQGALSDLSRENRSRKFAAPVYGKRTTPKRTW
jgi:phage terminase large subunit-like protein